jgi:peptidyl-prolyl cis-trans isomerase SurA
MKNIFSFILFFILAVLTFEVHLSYAIIIDRIAAVVNGEIITFSELEDKATPLIKKYIDEEVSIEEKETKKREILAQVLPRLIEDRLVQQEAKKLNIKIDEQEVEKAIDQICEENHITRDQFSAKLVLEGYTLEEYKKELRQQIERAELISAQVYSKIVITDEQVEAYLKRHHLKNNSNDTLYLIQHICITFKKDDPKSKERAREKIEEAYSELKRKKDFEGVARRYSDISTSQDGGYLGALTLNEMASSVKEVISGLKPGDFSEIVDTEAGWQIFRLKDIVEKDEQSETRLSQINKVRKKLYDKQINARFEEWLKELSSKSTIQILL